MRMGSLGHLFSFITIISMWVAAAGQIISTPNSTLTVNRGDNFSIPCVIDGPGNYKVSWWYMDQHTQLSVNYTKLTNDMHYDIQQPLGDSKQYTLQLRMMTTDMVGFYECRIDNTDVVRVHLVNIAGYNPLGSSQTYTANFTDCCVREKVSAACMPACSPRTKPPGFNINHCEIDLPKLIKCGADGRNHAPCCRRRFLPDQCLVFCMSQIPTEYTAMHEVCLQRADDITECYIEGQSLLPGSPTHLTVDKLNSEQNSVWVVWQAPLDNDNISTNDVRGYRLFYKEFQSYEYKSTALISANFTSYMLRNLDQSQKYMLYVVSIGDHGSSLPSYVAEFYGNTEYTTPRMINPEADYSTTLECCQKRNVSSKCQQLMCSGVPVDMDAVPQTDIFGCFDDISNALQCIACKYGSSLDSQRRIQEGVQRDERDHTQCCQQRNVPSRCYDICAGQAPRNFTQIDCVTVYMSRIVSCFEEGKGILPGPPMDVQLDGVTYNSIRVLWRAPFESYNPVSYYIVRYREQGQMDFMEKRTNMTSVQLGNLKPGTKYEIKVSSVGVQGASLPSTTLVALTYFSDGSVSNIPSTGPTATPAPPILNFPECCVKAGVSEGCQFMCNYSTDLSTLSPITLLNCQGDLGKMLNCGARNRNHTMCCQLREVFPKCLSFCAFTQDMVKSFTFNFDQIDCVYQSAKMLQCMQEGQGLIPSHPVGLTVVNRTSNTLSLSWRAPQEIPAGGLRGYYVKYRPTDSPLDYTQINISAITSYIIQNLSPGQRYSIQVVAHSSRGTSLPSSTVETYTLDPIPIDSPLLPNLNFTTPGNVTACCIGAGVSSYCSAACDGRSLISLTKCTSEIQKLLSCSADKRDHKPCCTRLGVPQSCQGLCEGRPVAAHISSLMCLPFIPQVVTCLKSGFDTLPTPPESFLIEKILPRSLTFSWTSPKQNAENVLYNLYYRNQFTNVYSVQENVTSPLTLSNLASSTFYTVFIVAFNKYGSSQPSSVITVRTLEENLPTVQVVQRPAGYLREGSTVQLICLAWGEPLPNTYWVTAKDERSNASTLTFQYVSKAATGHYTCIADNGIGGRVAASTYLKIQFQPTAKAKEELVQVEANKALTVHLVCKFEGYPNISTIMWTKDGSELRTNTPDAKMNAFARDLEDEGIIEAILEINDVLDNDTGVYSCHGYNSYGGASATITLTSDMLATPPTFTPAEAVPNVTRCCMEQGVHKDCQAACRFDLDIHAIEALPNPLMCAKDLPKFVSCAADGRDHSLCCKNKGLPEACLPICAGVISNISANLFSCIQHVNTIIDCMEEGHKKIPSQPNNVQASQTPDGYILVRWQLPSINPATVEQYNAYYKNMITGQLRNVSVDASKLSALLHSIEGETTYAIYMTASNHYGASKATPEITIKTPELLASAPLNLVGTLIHYNMVRLAWDMPAVHPGSVKHYVVYYRAHNENTYVKAITPNGTVTTYYLNNLVPGVKYDIYVTAFSSSMESSKSNTILIETKVSEPQALSQRHSEKKKLGMGLGISFGLLVVLTALGLAAFWYIRKHRRNPTAYKESVSFENPGYANEPKVTGIPSYGSDEPGHKMSAMNGLGEIGYSQTSSPSSKGSMHDDSSDQGYNTLTPTNDVPYSNGHSNYINNNISDAPQGMYRS